MNYVTPTVEKVANHYFETESDWAVAELQNYCEYLSEFISESTTPESYERFCLAILKIGKTSKSKFNQAVELGKSDYRDLLVAAGFGNSITIHEEWARSLTNEKT